MSDPRFPLLSSLDALPLSLAYQERDERDLDEQIRPLLSGEQGLGATAEGMQAAQPAAGQAGDKKREPVRTDTTSTSETVRDRAMKEIEEPGIRKAVDATLKLLTGRDSDELQRMFVSGELAANPLTLFSVADPIGNSIESVARETAQRQGLPPELVERVVTVTGVIGSAMMPPGKPGKGVKKAAEAISGRLGKLLDESEIKIVQRRFDLVTEQEVREAVTLSADEPGRRVKLLAHR